MKRSVPMLVFVLCLGGLAAPAAAEEGWGYDLANELMSPFCPGRALAECPSPAADQLRVWILDQERAGVPRATVEAELYDRWGDALRQTPRAEGVGLVAYAIPGGVVLAGAGLLWLFLRRQRGGGAREESAVDAPAPDVSNPELEELLDRELAQATGDNR